MEGATKYAHFLKQLQVDKVQQHGDIAPTVQVRKANRLVSSPPMETIEEELETEDEIMERQIALTQPAQAKTMAK